MIKREAHQIQHVIGIDCGKNTGFAVWNNIAKKLYRVETMPIHRAMLEVLKCDPADVLIVVEDARQVRFKVAAVRAQGAGSVKRDASIWDDFLTDMGYRHIMARPNKRGTKWSADQFKLHTAWTGRTSEHARDAAMLVYDYRLPATFCGIGY